jgi:hypothetical protein
MPGGDIEQFLSGVQLIMAELMHQGSASCATPKLRDDIGVGYTWVLMSLPGEAMIVESKRHACLLLTTLLVLGVSGPHLCALEIAIEGLLHVLPAINHVSR